MQPAAQTWTDQVHAAHDTMVALYNMDGDILVEAITSSDSSEEPPQAAADDARPEVQSWADVQDDAPAMPPRISRDAEDQPQIIEVFPKQSALAVTAQETQVTQQPVPQPQQPDRQSLPG